MVSITELMERCRSLAGSAEEVVANNGEAMARIISYAEDSAAEMGEIKHALVEQKAASAEVVEELDAPSLSEQLAAVSARSATPMAMATVAATFTAFQSQRAPRRPLIVVRADIYLVTPA